MRLVHLRLVCPKCGSGKISYSCEPKCCFSHICEECYFQFWPVTTAAGRELGRFEGPEGEKDCLLATAECAKCKSLNVCTVEGEEGVVACGDCGSVLELEYAEEAPE